MPLSISVAGGGIGGLAAALACAREGLAVRVMEQAAAFSETGAGIQLGPNVTRILEKWSVPARDVAAQPNAIVVRDAGDGSELGRLALDAAFTQRYGAPYLTLHRADLQLLLLEGARVAGTELRLNSRVTADLPDADVLLAADGVWSTLRNCVVQDGPAQPTGHFAFRALALQSSLPAALRSTQVTVWLAPRMHVVSYPVRRGEEINVVALVELPRAAPAQGWDAVGAETDLHPAMQGVCCELHQLVEAMPGWGVWSLHDRPPMSGAHEMAKGRVALLGDAAHPMLPYLAQGAGMAIEDADVLAGVLRDATRDDIAAALERYAQARWRRCAQVQSTARRNARIFHAGGLLKFARDAAMKVMGERLIDQPWLYSR
jgi:salicylate hydroxylase